MKVLHFPREPFASVLSHFERGQSKDPRHRLENQLGGLLSYLILTPAWLLIRQLQF